MYLFVYRADINRLDGRGMDWSGSG